MYPDGIWIGAFGFLVIWLGILSFLFFKQDRSLGQLFKETSLKDSLDKLFEEVGQLRKFRQDNLRNIQKVVLRRYNPYSDTGGDQSFTLALLNGQDDGVVITSLHSRAGTRIFAKPVKGGKEDGVKFAGEEEEVVAQAIREK